ncbi:hypothetical protein CRG98_014937 [Punica granatum]|uniref:Nucleosome assembly protein 12-like n=1 Tax=Punica granatum TaxID=22663 RepID=A0A2I0K904_PUNGR|nr:hypothetical protein CRG98_014937 [Punica granatum]
MPKALKRRRLTLGVFDKLEAEFLKERVALEVKYQQLYQPLYAQIFEKDEDALRYLRDIRWSKTDNPKGFKIDFFFYTNPYFKNSILTKIYHLINEEEPILEKATRATIRDKIIPHAIKWFIGKAQGNVYDLDDNEDVGDEDEDYSEEDDDSKDI